MNSSKYSVSINSDTIGSPVASLAATRISNPDDPIPWKAYGDVLGLNAPPLNRLAPAALAALASSDYNALNNLGNMYRQAEEYNRAQEERVANFNRQTDQTNSQMGLQTAMANQSALDRAQILRLEQMARVASARDAARKAYDARRSTNLNNFIQGLQNLGREDTYKSWLDVLANSGVLKMDTKGKYTGNIG